MKALFILNVLLFCSCSKNEFNGHVYDFDTNKPIKNVCVRINNDITKTDSTGYFNIKIEANSINKIFLKREGYASKKIERKPDSSGKFSIKGLKQNVIYLYNNESDFINK